MPKLIASQKIRVLAATLAAVLLSTSLLSTPIVASDAIQRIPDNALGFIAVRNLAQTSDKVDQLLRQFHITFPAPLAFAKIVTGLESGLDPSGDLVVTFLPSVDPDAPPEPMVLLPVTDYAEFAKSINGDTSGDICRVTLVGEDILIAKDGPYAMLMNVEHRLTMEDLVDLPASPITQLEPITGWLATNDISLVLMPPGIELLGNWKSSAVHRRNHGFDVVGVPSLRLSNYFTDLFGPSMRAWFGTHVELSALGIAIDDQKNVRLRQQLVPKAKRINADLAAEFDARQPVQLDRFSEPIVFAGGGPVAAAWGKQLATYLLQHEQKNILESGFENITPELWEKEAQAYQHLFADIRSCSVVMLPGKKAEPLLGNFMGIATVADVSAYFGQLPQVIETWNEFSKQSTVDIRPEFEIDSRTLSGKSALQIVIDVASTAQDPNVPLVNWLLEAMLGVEGKIRIQLVEITPTTFAFGLATDEQITKLITTQQAKSSAPRSLQSETTLKLLQPKAPWKIIVSPQGCTHWTTRVINEFLVHLGWQAVSIPDMPTSPPVGISVNLIEGRWECELVCPAETLKTVADYLETTRNK